MDRGGTCGRRSGDGLPRTRGDGPAFSGHVYRGIKAPPHTRGWTQFSRRCRHLDVGSPAHAGMDLARCSSGPRTRGLPRTRGDGPEQGQVPDRGEAAPPHTRGWTWVDEPDPALRNGSPAHAGMDPRSCAARSAARRLPRTRGDGPSAASTDARTPVAPPHTRGWTRPRHPLRLRQLGSPAHAGMDPSRPRSASSWAWLPRTRGDGPAAGGAAARSTPAPPHTRGWTPLRARNAHIRPQLFGMQVQILPNSRTYR